MTTPTTTPTTTPMTPTASKSFRCTDKMIKSFSQFIYDQMLIFEHSIKSAKRYVLQLLCIAYLRCEYILIQNIFLVPCKWIDICNFTSSAFEIIKYISLNTETDFVFITKTIISCINFQNREEFSKVNHLALLLVSNHSNIELLFHCDKDV